MAWSPTNLSARRAVAVNGTKHSCSGSGAYSLSKPPGAARPGIQHFVRLGLLNCIDSCRGDEDELVFADRGLLMLPDERIR